MPTLQTPQAGSNLIKATDGTPLNPLAVNLAKAIRQQESGGDYNAVGDNGESHGAYQFNKSNYQNWAKEQGQDPNDFSPVNQDKVAYTRIDNLLKQGRSPSEVAAIWNGAKLVNGKYQAINPSYVDSVKNKYATIVNSNPQPNQIPANAPEQSNPSNVLGTETANASTGTQPQNKESLLGKVLDFAFPILHDVNDDIKNKSFTGSGKSLLQQAGDAGQSALWFIPGIGEGAEAAIKGAGLLGDVGAKVAGDALGGAATGYASDVASKLSSGDTNAGSVLTPGIGTATGGVLGGVLGKVASKYSKTGLIEDTAKSNNSILGQTKPGSSKLVESFSKDKNPGGLLAQKGINLSHEINPETVSYDVAQHAEGLRNDANTLTDTLTEALKRVPGSITATDLETDLINNITSKAPDKITANEQAQIIKDEFAKIRSQYGEQLSAADMNELKKRAWNLSHFDASTSNLTRNTQRLIGNNLKTSVENIATKAGLPEVQAMNEYIGQHLDAADHLLGKNGKGGLNGRKAPGGRLGDMLKSQAGTVLGGTVGLPAGPVGALIGALVGHYGGKVLGSGIRKIQSSPIKTAMLKRLIQEDPEIVQKIISYSKQTPEALQALKKQLGELGIDIFKGSTQKAKVNPPPSLLGKIANKSLKSGIITTGSKIGSQANYQTP